MVRWSCAALWGIVALSGCRYGPGSYPVGQLPGSATAAVDAACAAEGACQTVACGHDDCGHDDCGPRCRLSGSRYHTVWDRLVTRMSGRHRAGSAFGEYVRTCGHKPSRDFRAGFMDGYIDVVQGGSGVVPPIPPERFWGASGRTPTGHQRAREWFAGYAAGADAALASCCAAYNRVPHRSAAGPVREMPPGPPLSPGPPSSGF